MLTIPATPAEIAEGEILLEQARQRMARFLRTQRQMQRREPAPKSPVRRTRPLCHRGTYVETDLS